MKEMYVLRKCDRLHVREEHDYCPWVTWFTRFDLVSVTLCFLIETYFYFIFHCLLSRKCSLKLIFRIIKISSWYKKMIFYFYCWYCKFCIYFDIACLSFGSAPLWILQCSFIPQRLIYGKLELWHGFKITSIKNY